MLASASRHASLIRFWTRSYFASAIFSRTFTSCSSGVLRGLRLRRRRAALVSAAPPPPRRAAPRCDVMREDGGSGRRPAVGT